MDNLINRQDAIMSAKAIYQNDWLSPESKEKYVLEMLEELPSAQQEVDLVAVVRCRDCMFNLHPPDHGNAYCNLFYGMTDQMGFCYCGERRSDE